MEENKSPKKINLKMKFGVWESVKLGFGFGLGFSIWLLVIFFIIIIALGKSLGNL